MHTNGEIFPRSTVDKVIFQIRYPNLFYIESRIGEMQLDLIKLLPETALMHRRQFLIGDVPSNSKLEIDESNAHEVLKIWQFKNKKGFELNITSNSLDITSSLHKSYNKGEEDNFRDVIEQVVSVFLKHINIPLMNRIGFRYIDICPLPSRDNNTFNSLYNSCLPIDRFPIENTTEMDFKTVVNHGDYKLRYAESLVQDEKGKTKLILDFDGFSEDIISEDYIKVTDDLHDIICNQFFETIKAPIVEYMRGNHDLE